MPVRRPGRHRAAMPAQWQPPANQELLARVHAALAAWDCVGHRTAEGDFAPGPPGPAAGEERHGRHRRAQDS
jgi:hypothetical protein